jgi:hypothetical protein
VVADSVAALAMFPVIIYLSGDAAGVPLGDGLLGLLRRRRPGHGKAGDAIADHPAALLKSSGGPHRAILEQAFEQGMCGWLPAEAPKPLPKVDLGPAPGAKTPAQQSQAPAGDTGQTAARRFLEPAPAVLLALPGHPSRGSVAHAQRRELRPCSAEDSFWSEVDTGQVSDRSRRQTATGGDHLARN